jgi:hypothetical protein
MLHRTLLVCLLSVFAFCAARPIVNDTKVSIREYDVTTRNFRPHDPTAAPDGALWYTGQLANKLDRLDPKSGEIKEYRLKLPIWTKWTCCRQISVTRFRQGEVFLNASSGFQA